MKKAAKKTTGFSGFWLMVMMLAVVISSTIAQATNEKPISTLNQIVRRISLDPKQFLTPGRYLIVPGKSLGKLSLEASIDDLQAQLGAPTWIRPESFRFDIVMSYVWAHYGIAVYTHPARENKVLMILLFRVVGNPTIAAENAKYRTIDGVGLESPRAWISRMNWDVAFRFAPTDDGEFYFFSNGLIFAFDLKQKPDQVAIVGVWRYLPPMTKIALVAAATQ